MPGVSVCVNTEGGSSIYERLWLAFFPFFFFSSSEGSTAALKQREGGTEGEGDSASGMMGQGRDTGKVELAETTIQQRRCSGVEAKRVLARWTRSKIKVI